MLFFKKISKRLNLYFKYIFGRFDYSASFLSLKQITVPPIGYIGFAKEFPDSIFCKKQKHPIANNTKTLTTAQIVISDVRRLFKYAKEDQEHWQSSYESVVKNKRFKDDCDGFALTCAEYLYWFGIDRKLIKIVFCETEDGTGHLVCIIDNILIDNRFSFTMPWNEVDYKWIMAMSLNKPGQWRIL